MSWRTDRNGDGDHYVDQLAWSENDLTVFVGQVGLRD